MARAPSICIEPGCGELTDGGRCADCEVERERSRPRRIRARDEFSPTWRKTSERYRREHPRCARCGKPATQTHHKRDRDADGTDEDANLESLCQSCHSKETAASKPAGARAFR